MLIDFWNRYLSSSLDADEIIDKMRNRNGEDDVCSKEMTNTNKFLEVKLFEITESKPNRHDSNEGVRESRRPRISGYKRE